MERFDPLGPLDLHIWLCRRERIASSLAFSREILSLYAPVAPDDWQFRVGKHGKPHLVNSPVVLDFNLSHSRDCFVFAVTAGSAIGIDIEYCDPARDFSKLARRFFQPQEYQALKALPLADRGARFYDLWTLKEARVKASGGALGSQLSSLGFALSSPAPVLGQSDPAEILAVPALSHIDTSSDAPSGGNAPVHAETHTYAEAHYTHYSLFDLPENYRLAYCVLGMAGGAPQVALREWWGRDDLRPAGYTLKARSATGAYNTG